MKEILIPLNFTTTPAVYDTKQSFSTSDEASGVLTFTTTADVAGTVASFTIRNASKNANRQTVLIERLDVNSSPFSYALKNPLPFGQYEGTVLLKKNLTVIASASFLFGVNRSLAAEVLPDLVRAYSLDELVENVETEVSNLKDAYTLTVSETVKGVNKTESSLQAQENVRYLNEHQRKANELERISNENARIAAEVARKDTFDTLVDSEVIEQTVVQEVAEKYQEIEALNAPEMVSFRQQLADTLNKSAITLTHMFADNTARDAYFVAHPTELVELQFIKVGTTYQQYLEGIWTDSVPIVSEQVSATNQPIVDTGEYFVAENTNEALQELGAHKASTENPHGVTKAQVGLGNVDNTSDANKPVSTAQQTALNAKANKVQEEWVIPTLLNGFTGKLMYRINQFNNLEIIGSLSYPSNLGTNTLPSFQLPMSHVPTWFTPSADFTDLRIKFTLNTDFTENVMARGTLSGFNGYFVIIHGGNRNRWHINMSIPMNM